MRVVIQRVTHAAVTNVETKQVVGQIKSGLFILIGIKKGDTEAQAVSLAQKIRKLRIFEETSGKMTASALDLKKSILLVSQFTLMANTKDGNRPSFIDAEAPERANTLYELVTTELKRDLHVETGSFGKYMHIDLSLDGPVTIVLET